VNRCARVWECVERMKHPLQIDAYGTHSRTPPQTRIRLQEHTTMWLAVVVSLARRISPPKIKRVIESYLG
jgi:hypothetical protein